MSEDEQVQKTSIRGKRRCRVCRNYKAVTEFYKDKTSWDGLQPKCKVCSKRLRREFEERKALKATETPA